MHSRRWSAPLLVIVLVVTAVRPLSAADGEAAKGGPDVMRPPQRGLRVTPRLAGLFARVVVEKSPISRDLELSDE